MAEVNSTSLTSQEMPGFYERRMNIGGFGGASKCLPTEITGFYYLVQEISNLERYFSGMDE